MISVLTICLDSSNVTSSVLLFIETSQILSVDSAYITDNFLFTVLGGKSESHLVVSNAMHLDVNL